MGGSASGQAAQAAPNNVYTQSAGALTNALGATNAAANYNPQQVNTQWGYNPQGVNTSYGYDPAKVASKNVQTQWGYNPQQAAANNVQTQWGYDPSKVAANNVQTQWGYDPSKITAGTAAAGISTYMNPYTNDVINRSVADIGTAQQQMMGTLGSQATAAGAFGGSRHGIAEGATNAGFIKQIGDTTALLRDKGWTTALGASQTDVTNKLTADTSNQSATNRATEFGQTQNLAGQTTNAANQLTAGVANQNATNRATEFGQTQNLAGQTTNAANQLTASTANQNAGNRATEFGQTQALQGQTTNANNNLQAQTTNANSANRATEFGQNLGYQAQTTNATNANRATEFGQMQGLQAQTTNQNAGLTGANLRLNAGNQLGSLAQTGFNMGNTIGDRQAKDGQSQQDLMQQLIDAAKAQWGGFAGAPANSLGGSQSATAGANMGQGTVTNKKNPGLLDWLTTAIGLIP